MSEGALPEQIANQLRRDILRGVLLPGTAVKERDFAASLGVSRTPMREAIRILAKEGLVQLRPARSPIVAEPSFEEVAQNIEVMTALEILSAQLACERASDEQIAAITGLAHRMEDLWGKADLVEIFELDMSFHLAIAQAAGNAVLAEMHRALVARLWRARYLSASRVDSRERVLRQHGDIVDALIRRDPQQVSERLRAHLDHLLVNVAEYFSSRAEPVAESAARAPAAPVEVPQDSA
jgi:DNA-binding GntR family transcriptional regulator